MSVSEKLRKILEQISEKGYNQSTPMFRSLKPEEVKKFREAGQGALNGATILAACRIFHPVTRLEIAYRMLRSLEESREIDLEELEE